jgi:hypothetical protein
MIKVKGLEIAVAKMNKDIQKQIDKESIVILNQAVDKLSDATPVDTGRAKNGWELIEGTIVNNVPYISELNEGHSQQASAKFVESTLISIPQIRPNGVIVVEKD